jgi:ribosomal-protein-alanine N-acetyltransferase
MRCGGGQIMPPPLAGDRVILRQFEFDDAADVFAYSSDPEVSRFVDWQPHATVQDSIFYIRTCRRAHRDFLALAIEHRSIERVIGALELRIVNRLLRVGEIGYTVARPFWGQGYNVESVALLLDYSFRELRLRRIAGVCDIANRRSYRTMEKLGMLRDRVIRHVRPGGAPVVYRYRYSILRQEWEQRRSTTCSVPGGTPTSHGSAVRSSMSSS